jgi:hypothetical protein
MKSKIEFLWKLPLFLNINFLDKTEKPKENENVKKDDENKKTKKRKINENATNLYDKYRGDAPKLPAAPAGGNNASATANGKKYLNIKSF